jgi:hypothetical protein
MKAAVRRFAGRVAGVVSEMNYAQQRMLALRTATDRYIDKPGAGPDTYDEFLARTSGMLIHEPSARKRLGKAGRDQP